LSGRDAFKECVRKEVFFVDRLTREDLKFFASDDSRWRISLFMPVHRAGRDTEQNPIRLKNLVRRAEEGLEERRMRSPEAEQMLRPARKLVDDPLFWQNQSAGLALFISGDSFRCFRVPIPFQELSVISTRFHFTPLLPLFENEGRFYILALSQNMIRLLEATKYTVDEVDVDSMLPALGEALQFDRFEKQLQFHTGTSTGRSGGRAAMYHGHDPSDEEKGRLLRWFHRIDDDLPGILRGGAPLVLAGVEYLLPLYREANSYSSLVEEGIPGNADGAKPEELHSKALAIVEPILAKTREDAVARLSGMSGTERVSSDLDQILEGAGHGRVEVLFVAEGAWKWGRVAPDGTIVRSEGTEGGAEEDLINLASVRTLLNGGSVYALERDRMPRGEEMCALYRY